MVDEDGRYLRLVEHFCFLLADEIRPPHYERSTKALQFAVKNLRMKRQIRLERWVN